jgi:hypothetical protein
MSLRLPQSLAPGLQPESRLSVLNHEIAQQKAETLGHMGQRVEQALARLRAFQATEPPGDPERLSSLLDEAAERAWALMIQREISGLRHWEAVVKAYGIPREVLNRMGRVRKPAAAKD